MTTWWGKRNGAWAFAFFAGMSSLRAELPDPPPLTREEVEIVDLIGQSFDAEYQNPYILEVENGGKAAWAPLYAAFRAQENLSVEKAEWCLLKMGEADFERSLPIFKQIVTDLRSGYRAKAAVGILEQPTTENILFLWESLAPVAWGVAVMEYSRPVEIGAEGLEKILTALGKKNPENAVPKFLAKSPALDRVERIRRVTAALLDKQPELLHIRDVAESLLDESPDIKHAAMELLSLGENDSLVPLFMWVYNNSRYSPQTESGRAAVYSIKDSAVEFVAKAQKDPQQTVLALRALAALEYGADRRRMRSKIESYIRRVSKRLEAGAALKANE